MGYLHPKELWRPRGFLNELSNDGDGAEMFALTGGPGLIGYDGCTAGGVPAALQTNSLVPDHAFPALNLLGL